MLRVQNPAKQAVSLALSLAVVVAMGDLHVARSHDQNKIHIPHTVCRYLMGACHLMECTN
jgi:hypothetical protein